VQHLDDASIFKIVRGNAIKMLGLDPVTGLWRKR